MRRVPMPPRAVTLLSTTPLATRTPLARSPFRQRPHLSLVQQDGAKVLEFPESRRPKSRPETGFPRPVKQAVRKRAGIGEVDAARCEACGRWLGRYGGEVQHRAARGSGGCTDAVINGPANAVLLCGHGAAPIRDGCHGACEDRDERMEAGGFWIRHGTTPEYDPRNVRVRLYGLGGSGVTVWLAEDGVGPHGTGYLYEPPDGDVA